MSAPGASQAQRSTGQAQRSTGPAFAVEVVSLVPQLWPVLLGDAGGVVGRAFSRGLAQLYVRHLRDYGRGPQQKVDDTPFGGGAGMILGVEPLHRAIVDARANTPGPVIALSPRGRRCDQALVRELAAGRGMILLCGRYEGFDERVRRYIDVDVSAGDFVLSAGDPAAWCLIDAVVRLLPGALGNPASLCGESFAEGSLAYPQYTRPVTYNGESVPEVLRSGDHGAIARWRAEAARQLTETLRPDLQSEGKRSLA